MVMVPRDDVDRNFTLHVLRAYISLNSVLKHSTATTISLYVFNVHLKMVLVIC